MTKYLKSHPLHLILNPLVVSYAWTWYARVASACTVPHKRKTDTWTVSRSWDVPSANELEPIWAYRNSCGRQHIDKDSRFRNCSICCCGSSGSLDRCCSISNNTCLCTRCCLKRNWVRIFRRVIDVILKNGMAHLFLSRRPLSPRRLWKAQNGDSS